MSEVLTMIVALMVLFWGSKSDSEGTCIMLFGVFTIYESERDPALPTTMSRITYFGAAPPAAPVAEADDEVEAYRDRGRDLWQRLTAAGFGTIDDARSLRLGDVGRIQWQESMYACGECESEMFDLWEVYKAHSDNPALVGRVLLNPLGHVCDTCGECQPIEDDPSENYGVIGPVVESGTNFFDILDHFERLRNPPPATAAAEEPPPAVTPAEGEPTPHATAYPNR